MLKSFKNFIVGLLPRYFFEKDTYKDNSGKGLFQRFLSIFEDDLDESISPYVDKLHELTNPHLTPEHYLKHLAAVLGYPTDITNNTEELRNFLANVTSIYKVKGTLESYRLVLSLSGLSATIIVDTPQNLRYDEELEYDSTEEYLWDTYCSPCSYYHLYYYPTSLGCLSEDNPSQIDLGESFGLVTFERLQELICWIEPLNANLKSLLRAIPICDKIDCLQEQVVDITITTHGLHDDGHEYDDNKEYDEETVLLQYQIIEDICNNCVKYVDDGYVEMGFFPC
jgi:phage tail-like protein